MDFDVVHLICAGLDVHKKSVVAAVAITDPITLEATYSVKSFSTNSSDIVSLRDWLLSLNCHDVCMESTGKYWLPIFYILVAHLHIILTHPKYVKLLKAKGQTSVMQNGLLIYSSLTLSKLPLFLLLISGLCGSFLVTALNFPTYVLAKKTVNKTA